MNIVLNGEAAVVEPGLTVRELIALLDVPPEAKGVAIALDAEVVPRGEWDATTIEEGARVEVVRASQGG
jgi:sulfur carrier protein